ncbi:MAG: bifunctional molybdenum cofactor biosynthesis protein MoaC/MoaB, partial [Bacteroidota bacterium]
NRTVPKGDVFEFSRAAGLLACKKTHEVIPDCHPLPVEYAAITHRVEGLSVIIRVEVHTIYKTGVEVEAMHGAAITALTMYDMLKPIDPAVSISSIRLESKKGGKSDVKHQYPADLPVALVTVNDRVLRGEATDAGGDLIMEKIARHGVEVSKRLTIGEAEETIRETVVQLKNDGYKLILLTGGSGLSPKDVTPEAVRPLIDRDVPGLMEAIRSYGQQRTPYAMLGRGIAGFSGESLIITLPGSLRGAEESMDAAFPYILHVFRPIKGNYPQGA